MLLHGETDASIAQVVGVNRVTLWRWQTQHQPLKAELARRRRLIWHTTADRYRKLLLKAADVLETELDDVYDMSRFRAVNLVLRMAGRIAPAPEVEKEPSDGGA